MGCSGIIAVVVVIVRVFHGGWAARNGEAARDVGVGRGAGNRHGAGGAAERRTDGHRGGKGTVGGIETGLDEILAFWLGHEGLQLGGGESVDEAGLGDDEQQDLCAGESGQLVGLVEMVSRGQTDWEC